MKNGAVGIAALLLALALAGCGRGGRPNVLLITLDTTRADRLGCYGATNACTPNLDRLAKDGAVYEQARTTCPLTLPAHASLLTGLTPLRHGLRVNDAGRLPETVATLPGLFRSRGYATAAFVSAAVLDGRYGLNRGFDHYDDRLPDELFGEAARQDPLRAANPPETAGDETANRVIQWFEGRRAPWFVWVHFYDAHTPYQPHAAFEGKGVLHPYDQEIAFVDEQVGRLVKMLKKRGEYRRTVVVAVGDHGESLGEHGELEHGMTLYEGAIRVPLIIKGGGRGMRGKRISRPVSITQVAPLLAAEAGSSWSAGEVGDRQSSLVYFETLHPEVQWGWAPQAGLVAEGWKWIESPRPELYDLAYDPSETANRCALDDDVAESMMERLEEARSGVVTEEVVATLADAAALERLRSLGYTAGGDTAKRMKSSLPARKGDPRRDVKDGLKLMAAYGEVKARFDRAVWTAEDYAWVRQACVESAESPILHSLLAQMSRHLADHAVTERALEQLERLSPDEYGVVHERALYLLSRGWYEQARDAYARALELGGGIRNQPVLAMSLGHVELALGNFVQATNLVVQGLGYRQEKRSGLKRLGDALLLLGNVPEAIGCYRKALAEKENWAPALEGMVWACVCSTNQHERKQALAAATKLAHSTGYREPRDLESLAVACAANGLFSRAREAAKGARDLIAAARADRAVITPVPPEDTLNERWKFTVDRNAYWTAIDERLESFTRRWNENAGLEIGQIQARMSARDWLLDQPPRRVIED